MTTKIFIDDPWTDGTYVQEVEMRADNNMLLLEFGKVVGKYTFRIPVEDVLMALAGVEKKQEEKEGTEHRW